MFAITFVRRPHAMRERDMAIPRLLVVDDDAETRSMLTQFMRQNGFIALPAQSEADINTQLESGRVDLILLDVMLGDEKGNDSVSLDRRLDDINRIGYLHDGRARTIDEAIRWHGGEAQSSKEAYEDLPTQSRDLLLEFLESL